MKKTSKIGGGLRALAMGALAVVAVGAAAAPARADVCFGSHTIRPNEPNDAGESKDAGGSDGSTLGLLRSSSARRTAGTGLVLVAGLGGAWLGSRRKREGDRGDRKPPLR
jgi:hypothetical protein